jgi:hypothetical protein
MKTGKKYYIKNYNFNEILTCLSHGYKNIGKKNMEPEDKWPVDLPWMKVKEEIWFTRVNFGVVSSGGSG